MSKYSLIKVAIVSVLLYHCCSFAQSPKSSMSVNDLYAAAKAAEADGDIDSAIHDYQKILHISPGLAAAYNNLGSLYYDAGQYLKAVETLQEGLRWDPRMATSHAVLGSAYLALGRAGDAISQFIAAVRTNPGDKRSEDLLEQALIEKDEYAQAADRIRNRLKASPDDQDAWYRLGKVYLHLSQGAFSKAEQIAPNSPIAHELHGEMQENLGDYAAAQREYEIAVKEAPDKPGTHEHLGNTLWIQALWPNAQKEFEAELTNDSNNCRAHWKLADCMLNEGKDAEAALSHLNTAVQRCPSLMAARVDRARALIKLQRDSEGLPDLLMAEGKNPDEPTIHFLLAKVYQADGQESKAESERELFGKLVDKNKRIPTVNPPSPTVAQP